MDWHKLDRFTPATGMLDTRSLLARADNCARCHVGSRTAEGLIRDMNHDMIAAGHPPLYFDMFGHQARLPAHWDTTKEALGSAPPEQLASSIEALRTRVLLAAMQLSEERRVDSADAPQPELSEFDCAACHHALELDGLRMHRDSVGSPLWQPWYTAGRKLESSRDQLRLDQPLLGQMLKSLSVSTKQRSISLIEAPAKTRGGQ